MLANPHAITIAAFGISVVALAIAASFVLRNVRRNEPGLKAPVAFALALIVATSGTFASFRLAPEWQRPAAASICAVACCLFYFADRNRFVRDPKGKIVADRWEIALSFAHFKWTRDKVNRHFFFTGDTGSGKTTGMNALLTDLMKRNPQLGGIGMANKGDEWFFLQWLAKKCGREKDLIRLRPRAVGEPVGELRHRLNVTGDERLPFTTRARILVDTAAALNPKDEKSFFKIKGAAHIGRALELLSDIGSRPTPTNAYALLTSEKELEAALTKLTEKEPTHRRIRLAEVLEQTYLKHEAKEQRAGEIGTSQNYLEYLGTPEVAEVFSSEDADTCSIADVDKGKIICVDVPQDYTTERQYVFTVMKLLLYRTRCAATLCHRGNGTRSISSSTSETNSKQRSRRATMARATLTS